MKNLSFLFLSIACLISCFGNGVKQNEKVSIVTIEELPDSVEVTLDQKLESEPELRNELEHKSESFTVTAKFIDFRLGDASHYGFQDDSGKFWDFAGCNSTDYDFAQELNENEADESNQGWGSNKDLQGKWFLLTIVKVEQPQYIDGPMVMANIIQKAVLIEE